MADPVVRRVMSRVTPEADESLGIGAATMTVKLTDGRVIEHRVAAATGTPDNPGTREDVERKFRRLAETVLPADRVATLVTMLRGLATVPDVARLAEVAAG